MKQKVSRVLGVIFLIVFMVYLLVTGVGDLTNQKELITVRIGEAAKILEVKHSVNFIPTGTDHYYIGIEYGTEEAYIIKAGKNWLTRNFTEDFAAREKEGMEITGLIKRITKPAVTSKLSVGASSIPGIRLPLAASKCIDLNYKGKAIGKLLVLGLTLAMGVCIYLLVYRKQEPTEKAAKRILLMLSVFSILWLILLIGALR